MQPIDRILDDYDRGGLSRRELIAHIAGLSGVLAIGSRTALAQNDEKPTFTATDLNHIALRVTDIERSSAFYRRHLGLEVSSQTRSSCFLRCKDGNFLALFRADEPAMDHYCFSIRDYDAARAVETLQAAGLEPRRAGNRVYFDDPDGLEVQVASTTHNV